MKLVIATWVAFFWLSSGVSFAQTFYPPGYISVGAKALRVTKSHIMSDSVVLKTPSDSINPLDPEVRSLVSAMFMTVTDSLSRGVGIAAPQVGVNKRVILVQRFDKENEPFEAYLNPRIVQHSKLKAMRSEGCLSVDSTRCEVERSYAILLAYHTTTGEYKMEMVEDFTARIFQHEVDHLDGILFTERAGKSPK